MSTYEYTDTYGGESNYSWVKKGNLTAKTDRGAMRQAKAAVGLTGCRGRKEDYGDMIAFYPYGYNTVLFLNW